MVNSGKTVGIFLKELKLFKLHHTNGSLKVEEKTKQAQFLLYLPSARG